MFSGTGNTAPGFTIITILFILWAFCSYIVRAWTKLTKTDVWGRDDTALSFSLVVAIGQVAAVCYAVHHGYGQEWASLAEDDRTTVSKALFASQTLFLLSMGATRASSAVFSARVLTMDVRQQRIAGGLVTLCGVWTLGAVLAVAIRPPISQPWSTLDGSQSMYNRWLPVEATGICLDFSTLALSAAFVWQLQMTVGKRLSVCAIFAVRLAILPVVACRLYYLAPVKNVTGVNVTTNVLTEAEMCSAIILASATCLKPFLQPFHPGWFVANTVGVTGTYGNTSGNSSKRDNKYYELSGMRSSKGGTSDNDRKRRAGTSMTPADDSRGDDASDELDLIQPYDKAHVGGRGLRADRVEHRAAAFASASPVPGAHGAEQRTDRNHISKTQAWSVHYD